MGYHFHIGVSLVYCRLEYGYFLIGELGASETSDEFFGLT